MTQQENQLKIRIPNDLKRRFHVWCIQNGTQMSDVLRGAIEKTLEERPKEDSPTQINQFFQRLERGEQPTNSDIVKTARLMEIKTESLVAICECLLKKRKEVSSGDRG